MPSFTASPGPVGVGEDTTIDPHTLARVACPVPGPAGYLSSMPGLKSVFEAIFTPDFVGKMCQARDVRDPKAGRQLYSNTKKHIPTYLPLIFDALEQNRLLDRDMILMAISTTFAESQGFAPIAEIQGSSNTDDTPFDHYDGRLGNDTAGDGAKYRGRGFVQLTGKQNYGSLSSLYNTTYGGKLDLVTSPESALDPVVAARLLALFLRRSETRIESALLANDLKTARKCVNGGTNGLPDFTFAFTTGLVNFKKQLALRTDLAWIYYWGTRRQCGPALTQIKL